MKSSKELLDRARSIFPALAQEPPPSVRGAADLMLDVTELVLWYRSFRLPSGVQRVQMGLIRALLAEPSGTVAICRFDGATWKTVDPDLFLRLLNLSELSDDRDDPEWRIRSHAPSWISRYVSVAEFAATSVLVSLGAWVSTALRTRARPR